MTDRRPFVLACAAIAAVSLWCGWSETTRAQVQTPPAAAAAVPVPSDLKPLLAPRQSEMRLVVQRYGLDRSTLDANYAGVARYGRGGGAGGRGRGATGSAPAGGATTPNAPAAQDAPSAAPSTPPNVPISPARIARLKRFDMDWQAALGKLDAPSLSPAAKGDLDKLQSTIVTNLGALEKDAQTLARVAPVVPFAPKLVQLVEARVRMEDVNSQKAASTLNDVNKEIAALRARVEAAVAGAPAADALAIPPDLAKSGADAADLVRNQITEWFNFYNGYDPMFTWWMGLPFKHVDESLQGYATLLRDKVAAANLTSSLPAPQTAAIAPAPAPKFDDVPDLKEIIGLPQDEMIPVVQRFVAGSGGGRGGRGSGAAEGVATSPSYYRDWLAALKSLDFDSLTRDAQVDYLWIRRTSETRIARGETTLDPNPPRKADSSGIPGAARGRDGLMLDLSEEMIPYTPEQLMALAEREYAWCENEMKKASRQMGFGDDWKKAVEKVKGTYVPPGQQPAMIRDLLFEAIDYLREKDLVTVPQVGAESLHMVMMSPQAQLSNPFFLGGSQIQVSYPTDTMEYDARMQSMRGNNPGFSHATAFHEMIPGHYLTGFMDQRFVRQGSRASFGLSTPFYTEGWALYWELTLYDMGFDKTPEQKVGALFWRMHRCARIIFSLKFHMGQWSPQECVEFLIDRVGHERDNATAEVRRSFQGGYGPLYQAGYLLGGLQLRALRKELVDSRQMTDRQFHDAILHQGTMPISLLRLAVGKQKLTRDMVIDWKFYGDLDRSSATPGL